MILHSPFCISARLLPAVRVGTAFVSIEFSKRPGREGRARYQYHIDAPDFTYTGDDLQSGCQGGSLQEGMESLLSFLGAAAESYSYRQRTGRAGENEDSFPANVVEWAYQNSDELSSLGYELQETKNLITNE